MARKELLFQRHIIQSYELSGGHARKWASDWAVGVPDLCCALPEFGGHFVEVKHLPTFGNKRITIVNPMTGLQMETAQRFIQGGALVWLAIVRGAGALDSQITFTDPTQSTIDPGACDWFDYKPKLKFPIREILENATDRRLTNGNA